jgi:cytidylate kinase
MKKIVIAIDGFSSCGKSTMAKQLAKELNYVFVDSGAMYRAITLYFLRNNINIENDISVAEALRHVQLHFEYNHTNGTSDIFLNNENVELFIREMQISQSVSAISANKMVREFGVAQQQQMGEKKVL